MNTIYKVKYDDLNIFTVRRQECLVDTYYYLYHNETCIKDYGIYKHSISPNIETYFKDADNEVVKLQNAMTNFTHVYSTTLPNGNAVHISMNGNVFNVMLGIKKSDFPVITEYTNIFNTPFCDKAIKFYQEFIELY